MVNVVISGSKWDLHHNALVPWMDLQGSFGDGNKIADMHTVCLMEQLAPDSRPGLTDQEYAYPDLKLVIFELPK